MNGAVVQLSGGVDKCKIGLVFPDMPVKGADPSRSNYQGQMEWIGSVRANDFADMSGGRKPHFRVSRAPAAWTFACQPLASRSAIACRFARHKGAFRTWTQFNPSKAGLEELNIHFQLMLEQGFNTLMRYGHITSIEFFADFDGADFSKFCYFDTELATANTAFETCGTVYLGGRNCRRTFCVYDKAKQLAEAFGQDCPSGSRLRLEARLHNAGALREVAALKNPFKTLCVVDSERLAASVIPAVMKFRKLIQWGLSAQAAFKQLEAREQVVLINRIPMLRPHWWDTEEVWSKILSSLGWMELLSSAGKFGSWLDIPDPGLAHDVQSIAA